MPGVFGRWLLICGCGLMAACSTVPPENPQRDVTGLIIELHKADLLHPTKADERLAAELIEAVAQQRPQDIGNDEIEGLTDLLIPPNRWTARYAAAALGRMGPRAKAAAPALAETYQQLVCLNPAASPSESTHAFEVAFQAMTSIPLLAPTAAECPGIAAARDATVATLLTRLADAQHATEALRNSDGSLSSEPKQLSAYNQEVRTGQELERAVAQQMPAHIDGQEIQTLISLVAYNRSLASMSAAVALGRIGSPAEAAIPALENAMKRDWCSIYKWHFWTGIHPYFAYKGALEEITGKEPVDSTEAECRAWGLI